MTWVVVVFLDAVATKFLLAGDLALDKTIGFQHEFKGSKMFKLLKLAPVVWMAYKWFKGQKSGGGYGSSRFPNRNNWR